MGPRKPTRTFAPFDFIKKHTCCEIVKLELDAEITRELQRAREKFPGKNVTALALMEEVGELATALFSESRERVREEAVQVAVMAMRIVLDGDQTLDEWRACKGLDSLAELPEVHA